MSDLALDPALLVVDQNSVLGKGAYGIVLEGTYDKEPVAVKNILKDSDPHAMKEFLAEAELMARIPNHPNVLKFIGLAKSPSGQSAIVTELCGGSSLLNARRHGPLERDVLWFVIRGIALGMRHLAANGVAHRDLACRNILLDKEWRPKVCDFGMSRLTWSDEGSVQDQTKSDVGPIKWMAPESLRERKYSEQSDVWMFGCTVVELVTGTDPFPDLNSMQAGAKVAMGEISPSCDGMEAELAERVQPCFAFEPDHRPLFAELCTSLGTDNDD